MTTTYAWAPITKVEDQPDGTVIVYGPVADAGVDRDKQRLNQQWLDTAMPAWMASGANVREQHEGTRAVGVGMGLHRELDGTHMLAAAVVDPVAVLKVRPGPNGRPPVLKGFSVGIKDPQLTFGKADAPNGEVVGGTICEVSLVDRPSNPRTLFTMVKADVAGDLVTAAEHVDRPDVDVDQAELRKALTSFTQLITAASALLPTLVKHAPTENGESTVDTTTKTEPAGAAPVEPADAAAATTTAETAATTEPAAVPAADTDTKPADEPAKPETSDLAGIIKAAVAEATTPLVNELTLVKADLAKVLALPEPGGPVGMRTAAQAATARGADAANLRAQAAELITKSNDVRQTDPILAAGYRERAADMLTKADA